MPPAVTDAYATAAEYRAAIDKTDTSEDTEVLTDLTAISRYIEKALGGRFFTKDAADATRVYDPVFGGRKLETDDIVSVTTLKMDASRDGTFGTTVSSANYELRPLNAADGPEPAPYECVYIPEWSSASLFTPGTRVQIVGIFGWPSVPGAIKRACIELTAILRLETPRANQQIGELGQIMQTSPQARGIVDELMRHYGKVSL